jgi:class 3 adenylate cyclase
MKAWLETPEGNRVEIKGNCYLGRSHTNTVRLQSSGASRRHAHIHAQDAEGRTEYWLADFGSTNGTLCNGKRVVIPCRLKDGDAINILSDNFFMRIAQDTGPSLDDTDAPPTVAVRAEQLCWLLMLDIKRYTTLSRQLDTDTLSQKVGTWLRQTRDAIEANGGVVDKLLGDAIFAYWKHGADTPSQMSGALRQLTVLQGPRDPDFRIVVHHGRVTMAGGAGGADNLSGPEVIRVFRMEKVCAGLQLDSIVSEAARDALPADYHCEAVGAHPLDGFPGEHAMFRL